MTEEILFKTADVKAKLREVTGKTHMDEFRALLADRLPDEVTIDGVAMCLTLLQNDLAKGKDGFTGQPIKNHCVGLPAMALTVMGMSTLLVFPTEISDRVRAVLKEASRP